jgi:hypothetical protein
MMISDPERIMAVWLRSGTGFSAWEKGEIPKPEIPDATYQIPTMCNPGLKERDDKRFAGAWTGAMAMFKAYRAKGAPIGFAPDPKTSHECGDSRYMAIPFFDSCLKLRLPKEGVKIPNLTNSETWLASDWESEPSVSQNFKGDLASSVWLPDGNFAKIWRSYITTAAVNDKTAPPVPSLVRAFRNDLQQVELQWDAKADIESGLQAFEIVRNGTVIATLPEKPNNPFGKSLFQGMSYHDTPKEPIAVMKFLDSNAPKNCTYEIRSINTSGIKSGLSRPVTAP